MFVCPLELVDLAQRELFAYLLIQDDSSMLSFCQHARNGGLIEEPASRVWSAGSWSGAHLDRADPDRPPRGDLAQTGGHDAAEGN